MLALKAKSQGSIPREALLFSNVIMSDRNLKSDFGTE